MTTPTTDPATPIDTSLPIVTPTTAEAHKAASVAARTMCLVMQRGRFGNSKKADMADVTVDSDKSLLRMNKTLLDSPEFVAIQACDSQMDTWLKQKAFASKLMRGGVRLVPVGLLMDVHQALEAYKVQRETLVDVAASTYAQRCIETAERLKVVYNPSDYPSTDGFRHAFSLEWSFVTWETPSRLKAISPELFAKEQEKIRVKLSAEADNIKMAMRAGLSDLIASMVDALAPKEDGKKRAFHTSTMKNLNDFLATFEMKNVNDDTELGALAAQARAVLRGLDVSTLRKDDMVRTAVAEQFGILQTAIAELTEEKPTRLMRLVDDDDVTPAPVH